MNSLLINLAYKYVAIAVMLAEINYCTVRLSLRVGQPISLGNLQTSYVSDPWVTGFGGTLETEKYSFIFYKSGILRRIQRLHPYEKLPLRELQWKQSRLTSLINTNEAYQMATNWLMAISVDLPGLECKFPHSVDQRFFYPDATGLDDPPDKRKRIFLLPIFHVYWGDKENPAVLVSIYGPTKEMLGIYQNDDSFSLRPRNLLTNVDSLIDIGDDEFMKYSEGQLKDLIARFAAVNYDTNASTFEGMVAPRRPQAKTNLLYGGFR